MGKDRPSTTPYGQFFDLRVKAFRRYGGILSLRVSEQPYEYLKRVYDSRYRGGRVLDFGCGTRKPLRKVLGLSDDLYHCCDSDPSGEFTYARLEQIPEDTVYEIIAANQVFEHLTFDEGIRGAKLLARQVAPGGILLISVPSPSHPIRFWGNPTHKTCWSYLDLCALVEFAGLDPFHCVRCNKTAGPRWYERPLINMICRVFRMDWCDTVYVVGRKEPQHGPEHGTH